MRIFFGVLQVLKGRMRSRLVMSNLTRMARGGFLVGLWFVSLFRGHGIIMASQPEAMQF